MNLNLASGILEGQNWTLNFVTRYHNRQSLNWYSQSVIDIHRLLLRTEQVHRFRKGILQLGHSWLGHQDSLCRLVAFTLRPTLTAFTTEVSHDQNWSTYLKDYSSSSLVTYIFLPFQTSTHPQCKIPWWSPQYVNLDPTPVFRYTNSPETSGPRAHCSGPAPVITGNALSGTEMFRQKM